ncbi:hypothetical protein F5Y05DRAFT_180255 [Hypoxylon sp. FL0543]|nr:hypothetical protein F5Y05DRAFT_180255 [Hypoxylon sp. FL0543]
MRGCQKVSGTPARPGCNVPNCKLRRESFDSVPSKYCKKHTCEHFSSPPPGKPRCDKWKEPWESVCSHHVICPISNCNQARLQFRLSGPEPKYRRGKFCYNHKCLLEECGELRSTLGQGPLQYRPYCNEHICQDSACPAMHVEGFNFCVNHKCESWGCPAPRASRRFCDNHNRCQWVPWGSCALPKEENQDFCSRHLQCETQDCRLRKAPNLKHCVKHTCRERDCKDSSGNYAYCIEHRCGHEGCGEHRTVGATMFCALHSCQSRGCKLLRTPRGLYCETHTCIYSGCGNEKVIRELCEFHFQEECQEGVRADHDEERRRFEYERERGRNTILALETELRQRDQTIQQLRGRNAWVPY